MSLYRNLALMGLLAAFAAAQTPPAAPAATAPAREPGLYATIQTSMGPIVVRLFENESPITVRNFISLEKGRKPWTDPKTGKKVSRPLYNGTIFHRVIPGFMIQGGDPSGTGSGSVGFSIKDEFAPGLTFAKAGMLAMANAGPNTGDCQFFITVVPTPHLNHLHTIFGQVVEGQDVAAKISEVPRNSKDRPRTPVVIKAITFERVGPAPVNDPLGPAIRKAAPAKPGAAKPAAAAKPKPAASTK